MAEPVLTASLTRLRSDINTRFPNRDKASDGWIGDRAHQLEVSGHNPDDTVGVRAEYSDPDGKPEVRAVDVDDDLRDPGGVTLDQVIAAILRTPADLRRLRYIIYNRRIWSRNTDWQPRTYTGSNPHTEHGHLSGDPAYDEDGRPWLSVLTIGDDMELIEKAWLYNASSISAARARMQDTAPVKDSANKMQEQPLVMQDVRMLRDLDDRVTELAARPPVEVDYDKLADALLRKVLTPPTA